MTANTTTTSRFNKMGAAAATVTTTFVLLASIASLAYAKTYQERYEDPAAVPSAAVTARPWSAYFYGSENFTVTGGTRSSKASTMYYRVPYVNTPFTPITSTSPDASELFIGTVSTKMTITWAKNFVIPSDGVYTVSAAACLGARQDLQTPFRVKFWASANPSDSVVADIPLASRRDTSFSSCGNAVSPGTVRLADRVALKSTYDTMAIEVTGGAAPAGSRPQDAYFYMPHVQVSRVEIRQELAPTVFNRTSPHPVPGLIEAEHYDVGGMDSSVWGIGTGFHGHILGTTEPLPIYNISGRTVVGIQNTVLVGLAYTVNVTQAGVYDFTIVSQYAQTYLSIPNVSSTVRTVTSSNFYSFRTDFIAQEKGVFLPKGVTKFWVYAKASTSRAQQAIDYVNVSFAKAVTDFVRSPVPDPVPGVVNVLRYSDASVPASSSATAAGNASTSREYLNGLDVYTAGFNSSITYAQLQQSAGLTFVVNISTTTTYDFSIDLLRHSNSAVGTFSYPRFTVTSNASTSFRLDLILDASRFDCTYGRICRFASNGVDLREGITRFTITAMNRDTTHGFVGFEIGNATVPGFNGVVGTAPAWIPAWTFDSSSDYTASATSMAFVTRTNAAGNWTSVYANRSAAPVQFDWSPRYGMPVVADVNEGEWFVFSFRPGPRWSTAGGNILLTARLLIECPATQTAFTGRIRGCYGGSSCRTSVASSTSGFSGAILSCPQSSTPSHVAVSHYLQNFASGLEVGDNHLAGLRFSTGATTRTVKFIGLYLHQADRTDFSNPAGVAFTPRPYRFLSAATNETTRWTLPADFTAEYLPAISSAAAVNPPPLSLRLGTLSPYVTDPDFQTVCVASDRFGGTSSLRGATGEQQKLVAQGVNASRQGVYDIIVWGRVERAGFMGSLETSALFAPRAGLLNGTVVGNITLTWPVRGGNSTHNAYDTMTFTYQTFNLLRICSFALRYRQPPILAGTGEVSAPTEQVFTEDVRQHKSLYGFSPRITPTTVPGVSPTMYSYDTQVALEIPAAGTYYLMAGFEYGTGVTTFQDFRPCTFKFISNATNLTVATTTFTPAAGELLQRGPRARRLPFMHLDDTPLSITQAGNFTVNVTITYAGRHRVQMMALRLEASAGVARAPSSCLVKQSIADICPAEADQSIANVSFCAFGGAFSSMFTDVTSDVTTTDTLKTTKGCVMSSAGGTRVLEPPTPGGAAYSGVALHLARETLTATAQTIRIESGKLRPGHKSNNGIVELRVEANGVKLVQINRSPERVLAERIFFGLEYIDFDDVRVEQGPPGDDGLPRHQGVHVKSQVNTRYWPRTYAMVIEGCSAKLYNSSDMPASEFEPGQMFDQWSTLACDTTSGTPLNRVTVEYESGRFDRAATIVRTPARGIHVVPRNLTDFDAANMSTCSMESLGATAGFTDFPVAAVIGFRAGEVVRSVTVYNADSTEKLLLLGVSWVRASGTGCLRPPVYEPARTGETIFGVTTTEQLDGLELLQQGIITQSNSFNTAHGCAVSKGETSAFRTFPRTGLLTRTATWGSIFDIEMPLYMCLFEQTLTQKTLSPTTQSRSEWSHRGYYTHRQGTYNTYHSTTNRLTVASGPTGNAADLAAMSRLMFATRQLSLSITDLTYYSVAVPVSSLVLQADWIGVISPVTAHQCARGLEPFNDPTVYGVFNISGTETCASQVGYVSCGETRLTTPLSGTLSYFAPAETAEATPCSTPFHTIVSFRGTVPVIESREDAFQVLVSTAIPAVALRTPIVTPTDSIVGLNYARVHYDRLDPTLLADSFYCEFADASGFEALSNTSITGDCVPPPLATTVGSLAQLCEADPACTGFTTLVTAAGGDAPGCLLTQGYTTQASAASTLWRRRSDAKRTCTWTALADYGFAAANAWEIDLASDTHVISLSVNGGQIGSCGGVRGMADGSAGVQGSCGSFASCIATPTPIRKGDKVTVSIPSTMSSRGVCGGVAARVNMTFTKMPSAAVTAAKSLPVKRPLSFETANARTFSLRMNPTRIALQMPFLGCASCPPSLSVSISSGDATQRQQAVAVQCGGSADSGQGNVNATACGSIMFCTSAASTSTGSALAVPTFAPQADSATATVTVSYTPSTSTDVCQGIGNRFDVTLLAEGDAAVSALGGNVRTYFVDNTTSDPAASRARVIAAGVAAADIRAFPLPFTLPRTGARAVLYDVVTIAEESKLPTSAGSFGQFACALDVFTSTGVVGCAVPTTGSNWLTVHVLQTVFADTNAYVTVSVGSRSVVCGGGRSFRGDTAASDQCNTYYTCYAGPVESGVTSASIVITPPATSTVSTCAVQAMIVSELSTVPTAANSNCTAGDMFCPTSAECIPKAKLCDGVTDCFDGTDEAYCTQYRLVDTNRAPACPTNTTMTLPSSGVLELNDCKLWAIANQDRFAFKPTFAFIENTMCTAFNCLSQNNPSNTLAPYTYDGPVSATGTRPLVELYAQLEQVDDFKLCSSALHCSSNGVPASSVPPCACACSDGFLGDACDIQKTMATVAGVSLLASAPNGSTALSPAAVSAITAAAQSAVGGQYGVTIRSSLRVGDNFLLDVDAVNPSATSQQLTVARTAILAPTTLQRMVNGLASVPGTSIVDLTATNVLQNTATIVYPWQRAQQENGPDQPVTSLNSWEFREGNGFAPVANTGAVQNTRSLPVPQSARVVKVVYTILGAQYNPAVYTLTVNGDPCATVELTTDNSLGTSCASRTVCTYYPPNATVAYNASFPEGRRGLGFTLNMEPFVSPNNLCTFGLDGNFVREPTDLHPVIINWDYSTPIDGTSSAVDTNNPDSNNAASSFTAATPGSSEIEVKIETTAESTRALAICLVTAAIALISCCCCCCNVRAANREEDPIPHDAMVGSNCRCFTIGFAAAMASVYFLGVSLAALSPQASHYMVVDEYRSFRCTSSNTSLTPSRTSRVVADGTCIKAQSLGANEGAAYFRSRCVVGSTTGSYTGTMQVSVGSTVAQCESSDWQTVSSAGCYNESAFFPQKVGSELQYLTFSCWSRANADKRFEFVETDLAPIRQPNEVAVPIQTLPATTAVTPSGQSRVYHLTTPTALTKLQRREESSISLGGFANEDLSALAPSLTNAGARFENVTYVDPDNATFGVAATSNDVGSLSASGIVFNNFGETNEVSGFQAASGAFRYQGVDQADLYDIGAKLDSDAKAAVTLTFWLKASEQTRGFAFFVGDYWHERESFASPVVERLIDIIESGRTGSAYFQEQWRGYYALYVSGLSRTLHLILAQPTGGQQVNGTVTQAGTTGGVTELVFDSTLPTVNVPRIFDGNWHQIAVAIPAYSNRRYAQLFVDGETSYTKEGWRQCFPTGQSIQPFIDLNATVPVNSVNDEAARTGPVAYIGHLNGGVYNLEVHDGFLEQERIIGYGSDGMKRYAIIDATQANALAYGMMSIFGIGVLITLALLGLAIKAGTAEGTTDAAADTSAPMANQGAKATSTRVSAIAASRGAKGGSQMKHFVPNVLRVAQTMALYVTGWRWPTTYAIGWEYIAIPLSLNFGILGVDALTAPLIQFTLAIFLLILLMYVSARDKGRFEHKVIGRALAKKAAAERVAAAEAAGATEAEIDVKKEDAEADDLAAEAAEDNWPHPERPSSDAFGTTFTLKVSKTKARKELDKAAKADKKPVDKQSKFKHLEASEASCVVLEESFIEAMAAAKQGRARVSNVITLTCHPDQKKPEAPEPAEEPEPEEPDSDADVDVEKLEEKERKALEKKRAKKQEWREKVAAKKLEQEEKAAKKQAEKEEKAAKKAKPPRELTGVIYVQTSAEKKALKGKADSVKKADEKAIEKAKKEDAKLWKAYEKKKEKREKLRAKRKEKGEPESQSDDEPLPEEPKPVQPKIKESEFVMKAYFIEGASAADFTDSAAPFNIDACTNAFDVTPETKWPDICPVHYMKLIRAVPEIHPKVHGTATGETPYICCNTTRSQWHALLDVDRHVCFGVQEDAFFVCPHDECAFTVCESCNELGAVGGIIATIRSQLYAAQRTGAMGIIGVIIVTLLLLLFLPVMRSALMILTCHPEWQCEFPQCYADFSGIFMTAVVYSAITVLALGVFFFAYLVVNLLDRKLYAVDSGVFDGSFKVNGEVDPTYKPEGAIAKIFADVETDAWLGLLEYDKTMLASLYDGYGFRWMCFVGPLDLLFKLALILPIILADPNTLTQLGGASAVESLQLVYFLATNSFVNQWLNTLAQIGGLHQALQLAFMALHRVAVNRDPDSTGFAYYMITTSSVYGVLLTLIFIKVVVVPIVADALAKRKQLQEDQYNADAAAYRGDVAGVSGTTVGEKVKTAPELPPTPPATDGNTPAAREPFDAVEATDAAAEPAADATGKPPAQPPTPTKEDNDAEDGQDRENHHQ